MQQTIRERLQFGSAAQIKALVRMAELSRLLAGWYLAKRRRTRNSKPVKPCECWCGKLVEYDAQGFANYRRPSGQWAHYTCVEDLRREHKHLKARFL